jgi:hypothetical protein
MTKICTIVECGNDLSPRSQLDICPICRGSMYGWKKRRPAEVLQRRKNLQKYADRMESLNDMKVKK